ncbi:baeRF2 domain-containing protein [Arthrobacter sp. NPDC055138]
MMAEQVNTTHAANKRYAELYKKPGPWITVYVDASAGTAETLRAGDVLPDRLRESLEKQGAAKADIRAVIDAVSPATGVPSPVSRYVLVREGEAEVNEVLPGAMSGPEVVEAGPIPDLVPLLKARGEDFPYVVAEVGRDGGEVHLQYARRNGVAETTTVEGDRENLTKIPGGGWSQGRYQHRTEEIWRKNADEIAAEIDRVVQASKARLLIIAGDIRARELVVEQLSEASRAIESTFESHTRTGGADKEALRAEIAARVAHVWTEQRKAILNRLANQTGQAHPEWTVGLGECIRALQQAQVGTLIMNDNALADHHVNVLNVEPWIATAGEQPVNGELLAKIPAPAALVRAAALTDARMAMVPEGALPGGKSIAALLRWPTGPDVPRG